MTATCLYRDKGTLAPAFCLPMNLNPLGAAETKEEQNNPAEVLKYRNGKVQGKQRLTQEDQNPSSHIS